MFHFCEKVCYNRFTTRDYYNNLNEKNICDNMKFWKVVKALLSNRIVSNEKITLMKGEKIIKIDQTNPKIMNNFFSDIIKNLEILQYNQVRPICQNIKDPVIKAIIKYRNHPNIIAIKERCTNSKFSFSCIEKSDISKEIKNLQINKATQDSDIPTKLIKNNSDLFADFTNFFVNFANLNDSIVHSTFSSLLKLANITPVHKKDSETSKYHYRPVSVLSNISKIHERLMFKQISKDFEPFFSKFQCSSRKGFCVQQCLLSMLKNCLSHDLLIAKLNAYRFSIDYKTI